MNRQDLQTIAEAYSQVQEKKDSSYLETDMKKRQENNEKARKDMEKVKGQKNPHFEETNIRGNDSAEQKKRLEKKRGMKLDDHPQFKKEEVSSIAAAYQAVYDKEEVEDIEEADSLAAMAARREKRLKAQRKREGTTATGQDFGHDYGISSDERKKRQKAEFDAFIGRGKKKTNEEVEMEGYKGKHGQSDKEYADSRSSGGKMVSGDSKMSGAEYTHGRRVKAENPGMQDDVGGKTKPKSQGKMDKGTRADLEYRKAALKKKESMKEELEASGKFTAEEIEAILAQDIEEGKGMAALGGLLGGIAGRIGGGLGGAALAKSAGRKIGQQALAAKIGSGVGGVVGGATGAALGAKKGRKGSAAAGGAVGGLASPLGSAIGGAIASSYEPEGNTIHEVFKDEIKEFTRRSIRNVV